MLLIPLLFISSLCSAQIVTTPTYQNNIVIYNTNFDQDSYNYNMSTQAPVIIINQNQIKEEVNYNVDIKVTPPVEYKLENKFIDYKEVYPTDLYTTPYNIEDYDFSR